jgi:23S rRNA (uracil1939-C5)-methyltransferase
MNEKMQVTIESMAFKGYGVGRVGGKVIFVPYSIKGEKAWVESFEEKKDYTVGRLVDVIEPSRWRTDPPCPYFTRCGGCQWQHIAYSVHGEFKREILVQVLKRIGRLSEIPAIDVMPSRDPFGYRVRVQLKVRAGQMGYYRERSHALVDIRHCPISHVLINQIIASLRAQLPFMSAIDAVDIHVSPEEGKGILVLHPISLEDSKRLRLTEFLSSNPALKGVAAATRRGINGLGGLELTFSVRPDTGERRLRFRASPLSFSQVNLAQNENLIRTVMEFCSLGSGTRALDLYSGIGNFTLPLATAAKEVIGIEENRAAVQDAVFNAEQNKIENCTFLQGRVEAVLKDRQGERSDVIVLDPPRSGCKAVLDPIVDRQPERILYVSCDPATFARDLYLLSEKGYVPRRLALIDMFPQSYHMEVVGALQKREG